jgi:hypothetical protein
MNEANEPGEATDWNQVGESTRADQQAREKVEITPNNELESYIGKKVKISNGEFIVLSQSADYVNLIDEEKTPMQMPINEFLENAAIISESIN